MYGFIGLLSGTKSPGDIQARLCLAPYAAGVYEVCPPAHCCVAVRFAGDENFPLSVCGLNDLLYLDARARCVCVFTRFSRISKYLLRNPGAAEGLPEGCMKCMCAIALPGRKGNENMETGCVIFEVSVRDDAFLLSLLLKML